MNFKSKAKNLYINLSELKGYYCLFLSAICFTLSTVAAKFVNDCGRISGIEIALGRYIFGLLSILGLKIIFKIKINPVNKKGLYARALTTTIAVVFFFLAVEYSTVTNANILNLTYPVFVAISSYFFLKEKITLKIIGCLILALIGCWFIIKPADLIFNYGDIFGFISGIAAGMAITSLKYVRRTDDSFTILYYLFFYGSIITIILTLKIFIVPNLYELKFIIFSAATSVLGQFAITYGQKFCEAAKGSIISLSRIFFAAFLGIYLFNDRFDLFLIIGTFLILIPNLIVITDKKN